MFFQVLGAWAWAAEGPRRWACTDHNAPAAPEQVGNASARRSVSVEILIGSCRGWAAVFFIIVISVSARIFLTGHKNFRFSSNAVSERSPPPPPSDALTKQ